MKKKENIVIIVLLVIMALAVIGVSYAAFNYSKIGEKVNTITTGAIMMSYEESDNVINLDKALPTKDSAGTTRLKDGEYFDFTISSTISGNANINYEISAKDVTDSSARKIDGSNIKLYLTRLTDDGEEELMSPETYNEETSENSYTGRPANEMSLYTSSMNSSETNNYRLRMYVTEEYNPQGDGGGLTFAVKINVYGKEGETETAGKTIIDNLSSGSTYDDGIDTFITGEDPNNYIWYSGKLWRAVSVNNEAKTTKLVTQWNISAINYSNGSTVFAESYIEDWLNDTTEDGFLGNLREPNKFIVEDAVWDATMDDRELGSITRPNGTSTVTNPVGLLNTYEYQSSSGLDASSYTNSYLNNGLSYWTLTPYSELQVCDITSSGSIINYNPYDAYGIRPVINLQANIRVVDGNGTADNPYRLDGDNDTNLSGTLLNTRYSGEYIQFGTGENDLYRIVSHEVENLTKITSDKPLKDSTGVFIKSAFDSNSSTDYSTSTIIGTFLNNEYLINYIGSPYTDMIEDNTTWYLGSIESGESYKLAKYTDTTATTLTPKITTAKIGLFRFGELMAGQSDRYVNNSLYWTLTANEEPRMRVVSDYSHGSYNMPWYGEVTGIRPTMNLKSNVVITSGTGTKTDPFILSLSN